MAVSSPSVSPADPDMPVPVPVLASETADPREGIVGVEDLVMAVAVEASLRGAATAASATAAAAAAASASVKAARTLLPSPGEARNDQIETVLVAQCHTVALLPLPGDYFSSFPVCCQPVCMISFFSFLATAKKSRTSVGLLTSVARRPHFTSVTG